MFGFNEWFDVMKKEYRKVNFAMLRNIQAKAFIYVIVIHLASNPTQSTSNRVPLFKCKAEDVFYMPIIIRSLCLGTKYCVQHGD